MLEILSKGVLPQPHSLKKLINTKIIHPLKKHPLKKIHLLKNKPRINTDKHEQTWANIDEHRRAPTYLIISNSMSILRAIIMKYSQGGTVDWGTS